MNKTLEMLGPDHAALMTEFLEKIKGKSTPQLIPILMEFKEKLPKDVEFTQEQKAAIINEALNSIPDEEKPHYKSMMKVLKII